MKLRNVVLVCLCLVGMTLLLWSQTRSIAVSHEKGIPGYLDPRTGTFSTRVQHVPSEAEANPQTTYQPIFFREQINATITNYDQSTADLVTCHGTIWGTGGYWDDATVAATVSGNTYTCVVPILVSWPVAPGSSLSYALSVSFWQNMPVGSAPNIFEVRSSSGGAEIYTTVPGNGQTVINTYNFSM